MLSKKFFHLLGKAVHPTVVYQPHSLLIVGSTTQFDVTSSMPLAVTDNMVNPGKKTSLCSFHIAVCYRKCVELVMSNRVKLQCLGWTLKKNHPGNPMHGISF